MIWILKRQRKLSEFINQELLPNIVNRFLFANRLDVVFDQYHSKSIKTGTRLDRGTKTGKRRIVRLNAKIPGTWEEFLSCTEKS